MTDQVLRGKVELLTTAGPVTPAGSSWHLVGIREANLDTVLRSYEGKEIEVTITVLDSTPAEPRRMRTIRDLTEPR